MRRGPSRRRRARLPSKRPQTRTMRTMRMKAIEVEPAVPAVVSAPRRRVPATLWLGLAYILALEALLLADVTRSGRGAVRTQAQAVEVVSSRPAGAFPRFARWVAVNMTPLVWPGYVVLLEGVLTFQTGSSPVRRRPHHFALLCLASVLIWCTFDWINFYY